MKRQVEYHLLMFRQLPPKLNLAPRPLNIGKSSFLLHLFMSSLKSVLLESIKKQAKKLGKKEFTMPLTYLCIWTSSVFRFHDAIAMVTQNWMVEKFTMCSRGQIMLEIHDAIAMVTQNWVGIKCDVFTR